MKRNRIKKPFYKQAFPMIVFIFLILYTISFLLPLGWSFLTSLKTTSDFDVNRLGLPLYILNNNPVLEKYAKLPTYNGKSNIFANYLRSFGYMQEEMFLFGNKYKVDIWGLTLNSLVYSLVATIITTFSHAICAYLAARYNQFPLIRSLYPIVIFSMLLPIVGNLASNLQIMRALHFYDNVLGLWIVKGSFLGTNFLIFYATFKGISWEYAEAAFIDGASHAKVLFSIMLPLAGTTLSALFVLCFITYWNDWNVNIVYMPSFPMVAYALYRYKNNVEGDAANMPSKVAGCLFVALPMFLMFVIFRKKLMGSLTVGGIKG